jgi:microsomal dipeptidase-like Zn-dependent dipeptidase
MDVFTSDKDEELYRRAMAVHAEIYSIDSHCDTPMLFQYGADIGQSRPIWIRRRKSAERGSEFESILYLPKVDIPKMREGMLDAVFMVAYLEQGPRDDEGRRQAVEKADGIIAEIVAQVDKNREVVGIARSSSDVKYLKSVGKRAIFIGLENGYGVGKDVRNIQKLADVGVRYITLSHNGDNDICDSAVDSYSEHGGLSTFGEVVVREMNRMGLMVDVSHASERAAFDAVAVSSRPVIASHSSVRALCDHPRNISDGLMRAIAEKGGVIQVCIYKHFLRSDGNATVVDVVDHIDYVVRTVGIDHVGIGTDFDGGGGIADVNSVDELPRVTMELLRRRYSNEAIAKVWGGNLMRVMDAVQAP